MVFLPFDSTGIFYIIQVQECRLVPAIHIFHSTSLASGRAEYDSFFVIHWAKISLWRVDCQEFDFPAGRIFVKFIEVIVRVQKTFPPCINGKCIVVFFIPDFGQIVFPIFRKSLCIVQLVEQPYTIFHYQLCIQTLGVAGVIGHAVTGSQFLFCFHIARIFMQDFFVKRNRFSVKKFLIRFIGHLHLQVLNNLSMRCGSCKNYQCYHRYH